MKTYCNYCFNEGSPACSDCDTCGIIANFEPVSNGAKAVNEVGNHTLVDYDDGHQLVITWTGDGCIGRAYVRTPAECAELKAMFAEMGSR